MVVLEFAQHELHRSDLAGIEFDIGGEGAGTDDAAHGREGDFHCDPFIGDRVEGIGEGHTVPTRIAAQEEFVALAVAFEFELDALVGGEIQGGIEVAGADGDEAATVAGGDVAGEPSAIGRSNDSTVADTAHDHIIHCAPGGAQIRDQGEIEQDDVAVDLELGRGRWQGDGGVKHLLEPANDGDGFKVGEGLDKAAKIPGGGAIGHGVVGDCRSISRRDAALGSVA